MDDSQELYKRVSDQKDPDKQDSLSYLFALTELRQLSGHSADQSKKRKLKEAFKTFGMDATAYKDDWGEALDTIYDRVGGALQSINAILRTVS